MSDPSIDFVVKRDDEKLWCKLCDCLIAGNQPKNVKQHIKSITHKKAMKSGDTETKKSKNREMESDSSETCSLCDLLESESCKIHPSDLSAEIPLQDSYPNICIAPPYIEKPTRSKTPFFTFQCGTLTYPPTDLETVLEHYCVGGPNDKLPNIDINLESQEVKSWSSAKHMLEDAHQNKATYWGAFNVAKHITNPKWWPKEKNVPGYTQVIIGSGPTDIGIHIDQFGCENAPVDTYITMFCGKKIVLMLPPNVNKEQFSEWFDKKAEFPKSLTREKFTRIKECGGYYFDLSSVSSGRGQITLFVPKGWFHWLLGQSEWAVIFGSSAF